MDVGCVMDLKSIAARYANKMLMRAWIGWATVTDGKPDLYPYQLMRNRVKGP